MPEKDPVQKWADKNSVEGDMVSWCTNEVLYAVILFGGKCSVATCVFRRELSSTCAFFFCGKQLLTRLSLSREVYGSYPPLSEANISHLHVIVWREMNCRILGAGNGRLKLVCYCLVGGKRTSAPSHASFYNGTKTKLLLAVV